MKNNKAWKWDIILADINNYGCIFPGREIFKLDTGRLALKILVYREQGSFRSDFGSDDKPKTLALVSNNDGISWNEHEGSLAGETESCLFDGSLLSVRRGMERTLEENKDVIAGVGRNPDAAKGTCDYWPTNMKADLEKKGYQVYPAFTGTLMTETTLDCAQSLDDGKTWKTQRIEGLPKTARIVDFFRKPLCLKTGTILGAGFAQWKPNGRAFSYSLRSEDNGKTWQFSPIADDSIGTRDFDETDIIELPDGRVLAMMRSYNQPGRTNAYLHQSFSNDSGSSWSKPEPTPIWGYPPHMILLKNGAILCTYAHRRFPYGVRACMSYDSGNTWDIDNEIIIRDDALTGRVGYPVSTQLDDETIVTAYSIERLPRVPYSKNDVVSWGGNATGDISIRGWHRDPQTQASVGGCHMFTGLARYSSDYVRPRGQCSSKVLYGTSGADTFD